MADVWVTVPTAGRETLTEAIDSTGIPRDRIVLVATAPGADLPDGCHVVEDLGEINIHRWWNTGIDYAAARGATHVLVINDDVLTDADAVQSLLDEMVRTGAAIASPGGGGLFVGHVGEMRAVINGACWLLDLSTDLRPDEGYRWWFGDNDLDFRARVDFGGLVSVPCYFEHLHANELTAQSPELQALADRDRLRWKGTAA